MSSEANVRDRAIRDHQAWLGYLQPDGLVVSAAALVDAQVILDTRAIDTQARFSDIVETREHEDGDAITIPGLLALATRFLNWPESQIAGAGGSQALPEELVVPLPELGETLAPTFALRKSEPESDANPWLLLAQDLEVGTDLDAVTTGDQAAWSASAGRRFERLLRETQVPIGILSNGLSVRLVYAPRGESTGSLTFPVQAMTEVAGRTIVAALHELLSAYRLLGAPADARLAALLQRSREYQSTVSTDLAGQVLEALYELLRGLQAADERTNGELLGAQLASEANKIYEGLLSVLMRLVFLLYAEDRGLMPDRELYLRNYSIHGLFERLRVDNERYPDTMEGRYGAWSQLLATFRTVHAGCRHPQMRMPARHGHLFDPERFPFLEGRTLAEARLPLIADGTIFRVLSKLSFLDGQRLSYRTLDVEQIGSVYQAMMGFRLDVASGLSIALKPKKSHGAPVPVNLEALLATPPSQRGKWLKEVTETELKGEAAKALREAETTDDLLAALEKRVARGATPAPVARGTMLFVPSDERRRSGSHYTPRSLTAPIVAKTLEPILDRLRREGGEKGPTPDAILDLKVCDPTVGSGAFLVEACRQLADELVKTWYANSCVPALPMDEDELLHARRIVVQRCLYGLDKNPMAVDLAKLSLWLATLAKDHPFTFLDHSIRCGDALVGLSLDQIAGFHWEPKPQIDIVHQMLSNVLAGVQIKRSAIEVVLTDPEYALKECLLLEAEQELGQARFAGDLVVSAFFASDKQRSREAALARHRDMLRALLEGGRERGHAPDAMTLSSEHRVTPFHWALEFPEVFRRPNGGFDAFVGNPPFLSGRRISTTHGPEYLAYLAECYAPAGNLCDLVGYFFRRAFSLIRRYGTLGLVATNTIAQGDTREGALLPIREQNGWVYSARRHLRWPGEAAVVVSVVHIQRDAAYRPVVLDGIAVDRISAFLFPRGSDTSPVRLAGQHELHSLGSKIYGQGFLFADDDPEASPTELMAAILARKPSLAARVQPYVVGEDFNSHPRHQSVRYAINLSDLREEADLAPFAELAQIVREKVKPVRDALGSNPNNVPLKRRWWAYQAHRPDFYAKLNAMKRFLAICRTTQCFGFSFVHPGAIYSEGLVVIALSEASALAILQSRTHEAWARSFSSTMGDALRYTPSDCFETFPFPDSWESNAALDENGRDYYEYRTHLMVESNEGLTKTYNRFHDPEETSQKILRLRELHDAMDRAVLDAYGWTDIQPACTWVREHPEDEDDGTVRWRWPDETRDEVLARLLVVNAERAEQQRLAGAAVATARSVTTRGKGGRKKSAPTASDAAAPTLFENE